MIARTLILSNVGFPGTISLRRKLHDRDLHCSQEPEKMIFGLSACVSQPAASLSLSYCQKRRSAVNDGLFVPQQFLLLELVVSVWDEFLR